MLPNSVWRTCDRTRFKLITASFEHRAKTKQCWIRFLFFSHVFTPTCAQDEGRTSRRAGSQGTAGRAERETRTAMLAMAIQVTLLSFWVTRVVACVQTHSNDLSFGDGGSDAPHEQRAGPVQGPRPGRVVFGLLLFLLLLLGALLWLLLFFVSREQNTEAWTLTAGKKAATRVKGNTGTAPSPSPSSSSSSLSSAASFFLGLSEQLEFESESESESLSDALASSSLSPLRFLFLLSWKQAQLESHQTELELKHKENDEGRRSLSWVQALRPCCSRSLPPPSRRPRRLRSLSLPQSCSPPLKNKNVGHSAHKTTKRTQTEIKLYLLIFVLLRRWFALGLLGFMLLPLGSVAAARHGRSLLPLFLLLGGQV